MRAAPEPETGRGHTAPQSQALLERAAQNARAAQDLAGSGDYTALFDLAQRAERAALGWRLLVTEFRIHAARDPGLNRPYAALHAGAIGTQMPGHLQVGPGP